MHTTLIILHLWEFLCIRDAGCRCNKITELCLEDHNTQILINNSYQNLPQTATIQENIILNILNFTQIILSCLTIPVCPIVFFDLIIKQQQMMSSLRYKVPLEILPDQFFPWN